MELHFPSFPLIVTYLIIPILFIFILKTLTSQKEKRKLPPGPRKLPIIGNLLDIGTQPHLSLTTLAKKYGPIMHLKLGEISAVIISSPELAKEALSTNDPAFADRAGMEGTKIMLYDHKDVGFCPYGSYWTQMRKICKEELLSASKVRSFKSIREEELHTLVQSIRNSSGLPIDLTKIIYKLQNVLVCRAAVGNRSKDQDMLLDIIMKTVAATGGFSILDLFPSLKFLHVLPGCSASKLKKMHQEMDQILEDIINEHIEHVKQPSSKATKEEDLLDVLLRLKISGDLKIPITNENIKAVILDMFMAGTDTSSTVVEWAMAEMMKNPRVMEKAQAELRQVTKGNKSISETDLQDCTYIKLVLKETMRMHVPLGFLVPRMCREKCEVGGYTMPIKTQLIVNAWGTARIPKYWHDAESFLPERFEGSSCNFKASSYEFIPFGAGRRMCQGVLYGLTNVEFTVAQLLFHFDWKLPNGLKPEDLDMTDTFGATIRLKNNLMAVPTPWSPSQSKMEVA